GQMSERFNRNSIRLITLCYAALILMMVPAGRDVQALIYNLIPPPGAGRSLFSLTAVALTIAGAYALATGIRNRAGDARAVTAMAACGVSAAASWWFVVDPVELVHVPQDMLLGALLCLTVSPGRRPALYALLVGCGVSFADELLQWFHPQR